MATSASLHQLFRALFPVSSSGNDVLNNTIIDAIVQNILQNNNNAHANDASTSSSNNNARHFNNEREILLSILQNYNRNISDFVHYNYPLQEFREYNANIKTLIQMFQRRRNNGTESRHLPTNFYSGVFTSFPHRNDLLNSEQIRNHVIDVSYNSEIHTEPRCPIAMTLFENGDNISMLHCGHYFNRESFSQYLRRGRTCPICRQDIVSSANTTAQPSTSASVSTNDTNISTNDTNVSTNDTNVSTNDNNVSTNDNNVSTEQPAPRTPEQFTENIVQTIMQQLTSNPLFNFQEPLDNFIRNVQTNNTNGEETFLFEFEIPLRRDESDMNNITPPSVD